MLRLTACSLLGFDSLLFPAAGLTASERILMRGDCKRLTFAVGSVLCVPVVFTSRVLLKEVWDQRKFSRI